jgi:hypothetical protein
MNNYWANNYLGLFASVWMDVLCLLHVRQGGRLISSVVQMIYPFKGVTEM